MNDESYMEAMADIAFEQMSKVDDDVTKLAEPLHTVAIIFAAQGIIDNGGLRYFFESNWPWHTSYSIFADAYERIGRTAAAKSLRDAAATFGIPDPEHDCDARRDYIEEHYDDDTHEVTGWNDCICGDEQVWSDLASWLRDQKK